MIVLKFLDGFFLRALKTLNTPLHLIVKTFAPVNFHYCLEIFLLPGPSLLLLEWQPSCSFDGSFVGVDYEAKDAEGDRVIDILFRIWDRTGDTTALEVHIFIFSYISPP